MTSSMLNTILSISRALMCGQTFIDINYLLMLPTVDKRNETPDEEKKDDGHLDKITKGTDRPNSASTGKL